MKFTKLTKIFGILFGLSLFVIAYLSLAIAIVLAFAKKGDFAIMIYVFASLAIATIIGSALAKKSILISRIILTLSTTVLLATIIYLISVALFKDSATLLVVFTLDFLLGFSATLFAYLAKPQKSISKTTEE